MLSYRLHAIPAPNMLHCEALSAPVIEACLQEHYADTEQSDASCALQVSESKPTGLCDRG